MTYKTPQWTHLKGLKRSPVPPWEQARRLITPTATVRDFSPKEIVTDVESFYQDLKTKTAVPYEREFTRKELLDDGLQGIDYDNNPEWFKQYLGTDHDNMYQWDESTYHVARIQNNTHGDIHFFYQKAAEPNENAILPITMNPKDGILYFKANITTSTSDDQYNKIHSIADDHGYTII